VRGANSNPGRGISLGRRVPTEQHPGKSYNCHKGIAALVFAIEQTAVEAAPSSAVANALILFSVSMVNVILYLLCSVLFAVNPWITPKCLKSKQLMKSIDEGEKLFESNGAPWSGPRKLPLLRTRQKHRVEELARNTPRAVSS